VDLAAERLGGRLALGPAEGGGLLAELEIPCEPLDRGRMTAERLRSPA
jgi:hypothetical protein